MHIITQLETELRSAGFTVGDLLTSTDLCGHQYSARDLIELDYNSEELRFEGIFVYFFPTLFHLFLFVKYKLLEEIVKTINH